MASGGNDQNVEYELSKLLQIGTVAEYESEFVILENRVTGFSANLLKSFYIFGLKLELQQKLFRSRPTTLGEAFFFARIAEAHFVDKQSTIAIAKPNELTANVHVQDLEQTTRGRGDEPNRIPLVTIHHIIFLIIVEVLNQIFSPHGNSLQGRNIYEGCCQLDIQFSNLEELQENQEEHICYYYWENYFSILNAEETGNTKSTLSADTFGNSGVDESETSGPETHAKEVVDNGNGYALIFLVGYDTETSSKKWVDSGNGRRDYTLFGASLFAFLNPGSGYFARRRIWDPEINISSRKHLEGKEQAHAKVERYLDTTSNMVVSIGAF
uniref:Uncharacterized protein n=1 Tax=Tanacetum cinerariifolium TaxID=118510 RepID=A0A6L2M9Y1_TANCI|nr:hypothetical protein [Tanacetum cinerariifolium]